MDRRDVPASAPASPPAPARSRASCRTARSARPQAAKDDGAASATEVKRTVCTHCSVGCAIDAVVENGVWVRQEPVFDSPLNLGAHCAKGASVREHGHGEHRLKTPMKLVNGKYQKITWEQAINEVGDKLLAIRKEIGPRRRVLGRQLEAQQRAGVPVAQVRVVLRHEQHATTRRASATRRRSPA